MICTVEDLDALPERSVLLTKGGLVKIRRATASGKKRLYGEPGVFDFKPAVEQLGPLTVLYRPDLPPQDELAAERDRLRAAVDAALALHRPKLIHRTRCWCGEDFPCTTVRALDPDKEQP